MERSEDQPWSMGWQPNYQSEARIYARYIQKNYPGKTVGMLYQNDDFGKDYLTGLPRCVRPGQVEDHRCRSAVRGQRPTVDSQVVQIKGANPDIFVNIATPKFAAQAIKKIGEMKWTSGPLPHQCLGFGGVGHEACGF